MLLVLRQIEVSKLLKGDRCHLEDGSIGRRRNHAAIAKIFKELIIIDGLTLKQKRSKSLLLALLNSLSDFDGELSEEAMKLLDELKSRSQVLPPLYADVFALPDSATCADLVDRITSLSQEQVAIVSYAFQIFRYYEQILRANPSDGSLQQKAAYESQVERVRLSVARTKTALAEAMEK